LFRNIMTVAFGISAEGFRCRMILSMVFERTDYSAMTHQTKAGTRIVYRARLLPLCSPQTKPITVPTAAPVNGPAIACSNSIMLKSRPNAAPIAMPEPV
jgi:hypothetical protein